MLIRKRRADSKAVIRGTIRTGRSTKQLVKTLRPKQIAVICHTNLDEVAARGLIEAKVKAVVNSAPTMTGRYPVEGPGLLFQAGIPIFEVAAEAFDRLLDGEEAEILGDVIETSRGSVPCRAFTEQLWKQGKAAAEVNLGAELSDFIDNTLAFAKREKEFVIHPPKVAALRTPMSGKHVVVVVRGSGYKEDLRAIHDYIEDYKPVLIGVDGGADALLDSGFVPHMIVGDMDSVSDDALRSGAELVVHAYADGRAPGMHRIRELGLPAKTIAAPGTSEDIAMLIAYEKNAELIITLGAHSHMIDFLEKGRKGMSSTMLVRMKIGARLIDAKGVSKLYHRPFKLKNIWVVPLASLFPLLMLSFIHPGLRHIIDVLWTYVVLLVS